MARMLYIQPMSTSQRITPHARLANVAAQRCIAMRVRRLSRIVTRTYDEALRPHGLTVAQFTLVAFVAGTGPVSPSEVGKSLDLEKSTLSRNLHLLSEQGLLRTRPSSSSVGQLIELSAKGKKTFTQAMETWENVQQRLERVVGTDLAATLDRLSKAIREL